MRPAEQGKTMEHSERQSKCKPIKPERLAIPEFYMPAMWPIGIQQLLVDWFTAWRKRQLYRRLLRLSDRQLRRRDLSRPRIIEKAERPLRQIVVEQRSQRARNGLPARRRLR